MKAIHVPETAITNYRLVAAHLAKLVEAAGGAVVTGAAVTALRDAERDVTVETTAGAFIAGIAVNCGGLQSDRLAALAGQTPPARIVPFRGEYYYLIPSARRLCRNLIYPTPDPRFPFLGVHFHTADFRGRQSGAGVRAQAVAADGTLLDDFCFSGSRRVLNVINAPSPAATASLAIGRHIVREVETRFEC